MNPPTGNSIARSGET